RRRRTTPPTPAGRGHSRTGSAARPRRAPDPWWVPCDVPRRSGGDAEALEAEGLDGVAAEELVGLFLAETGLGRNVGGDLQRVGERRVRVRVVHLEADLVHPDHVALAQADLVVEDAAVDPV